MGRVRLGARTCTWRRVRVLGGRVRVPGARMHTGGARTRTWGRVRVACGHVSEGAYVCARTRTVGHVRVQKQRMPFHECENTVIVFILYRMNIPSTL